MRSVAAELITGSAFAGPSRDASETFPDPTVSCLSPAL